MKPNDWLDQLELEHIERVLRLAIHRLKRLELKDCMQEPTVDLKSKFRLRFLL